MRLFETGRGLHSGKAGANADEGEQEPDGGNRQRNRAFPKKILEGSGLLHRCDQKRSNIDFV